LGLDKNLFRTNDDGEPNNTAGKPILGQIDALHLTNILVVVVRYYGGTKLGVGGLIDAYKNTASHTLSSSKIVEKPLYDILNFTTDYVSQQNIYTIIRQYNGQILETNLLGNNISILVKVASRFNINTRTFLETYPFLQVNIISTRK
jgi:putative IMPACT (imprinted ancient) family translation regulator